MKRWWHKPIKRGSFRKIHAFIFILVFAAIVEILSSPAARVWFGLLIVGSILVAVFLQVRTQRDGEL
jgi:hypothetical protein